MKSRPGLTLLSLLALIVLAIGVVMLVYAFNYWIAIPLVFIGIVVLVSRAYQRRRGPAE